MNAAVAGVKAPPVMKISRSSKCGHRSARIAYRAGPPVSG